MSSAISSREYQSYLENYWFIDENGFGYLRAPPGMGGQPQNRHYPIPLHYVVCPTGLPQHNISYTINNGEYGVYPYWVDNNYPAWQGQAQDINHTPPRVRKRDVCLDVLKDVARVFAPLLQQGVSSALVGTVPGLNGTTSGAGGSIWPSGGSVTTW